MIIIDYFVHSQVVMSSDLGGSDVRHPRTLLLQQLFSRYVLSDWHRTASSILKQNSSIRETKRALLVKSSYVSVLVDVIIFLIRLALIFGQQRKKLTIGKNF